MSKNSLANLKADFKKKLIAFLPFVILTILLGYSIVFIANYGGSNPIEQDLITIIPIFLTLNFALLVGLFAINLKDIWAELKSIKRTTWILLFFIILVAFILRMFVVPHTHRILFDEDIYLSMGRTMLLEGRGCLCDYGTAAGKCLQCFNYKDPKGYPFILAVTFLIFGISETVAFNLVTILSIVSVLLAFLIARSLFNKDSIALFSALLITFSPLHIIWSGTVASEPVLLFFMLLSIWISLLYAKKNNLKMMLLLVALLAFSIQIKADGFMLLPLIAFTLIVFNTKLLENFGKIKFFLPVLLLFFFVSGPYLIHFYTVATTNDWEAPNDQKFSLEYGQRNIPNNLSFLVVGEKGIEQPRIYIIFAVIGIVFSFVKYRKAFYLLASWLILFFAMYGFFFAGDVGWGSNERFALTYYTPLVFFGGAGMYFVITIINKKLNDFLANKKFKGKKLNGKISSRANFIVVLISISVVISFLFVAPHVATPADKIEEAVQSRTYHDFVVSNMDKIGKDCYVFSHVPSIFLMYGKNSAQLWYADKIESNCKIYDEGYWCNVDPFRAPNSICKQMHETHTLSLLAQRKLEEYNNHTYSLYYVLK